MKKLKFEDISVGDWIYWVADEGETSFVSNVISIDREKSSLIEEWWAINDTLNKFDKFNDYKINDIFTNENLKSYDIVKKMTEKQIKDFKVKLTIINL